MEEKRSSQPVTLPAAMPWTAPKIKEQRWEEYKNRAKTWLGGTADSMNHAERRSCWVCTQHVEKVLREPARDSCMPRS